MKEKMIQKINSEVELLETKVKNGIALTAEEVNQAKMHINNASSLAGLTQEELDAIYNKIDNLSGLESTYGDKFLTVSKTKLTNNARRNLKRAEAAVAAAAVAITLVGCTAKTVDEESVETQAVETPVEPEVKTTMDEEYKEIADKALAFAQNEVENGLPKNAMIDDKNKDQMIKSLTLYYLMNQMDNLTDVQIANIFQNSSITAEDIMNAKHSWEWIDEQRVTVSDNALNYDLLYEGEDAELLNKAAKLLNNIKSSEGEEKEEAISKFKKFIKRKLANSENERMQYSERALDTFRATYFDAFDELTNHAKIDDELEHAINTSITCSMKDSNLNVEDANIQSLQSEFETYEMEKLDLRLKTGWNFVALNYNDINQYNDVKYMIEYVSENIDLSKQFELPDYEETLKNMFLVNDGKGKSEHDSGISDGQGGIISNDVDNGGIAPGETKDQYEDRIKKQEKDKEDKTKKIVNKDGKVIENTDSATYAKDYSEGYNDGLKGKTEKSNSSQGYKDGYSAGKKAKAEAESQYNFDETETHFVDTKDKVVDTDESVTTQGYTNNNTSSSKSNSTSSSQASTSSTSQVGTTFVPVYDGEETTTESEITTFEYVDEANTTTTESEITTYDFVDSTKSSDYKYDPTEQLNQLKSLRSSILTTTGAMLDVEPVSEKSL